MSVSHKSETALAAVLIFCFSLSAAPQVEAKTCKQMRSCEEAVLAWCQGDSRKDGDGDGIPCENICRSIKIVDAIRRRIGC